MIDESDTQQHYDTLRENATRFYDAFVQTVFNAIAEKQLTVRTGVSVLLSAASGVAAQLDEPGIDLFEEIAADIASNMRQSKAQYDAATQLQ